MALLAAWGFALPAVAQAPAGQFAAGGFHSLSRHADGTRWAWGQNAVDQLGYPHFFLTPRPIAWGSVVNATRPAMATGGLVLYPTLLTVGEVLHYVLDAAPAGTELTLYTLVGQPVATHCLGAPTGTIPVRGRSAGWYLARLRRPDGRTATSRFLLH